MKQLVHKGVRLSQISLLVSTLLSSHAIASGVTRSDDLALHLESDQGVNKLLLAKGELQDEYFPSENESPESFEQRSAPLRLKAVQRRLFRFSIGSREPQSPPYRHIDDPMNSSTDSSTRLPILDRPVSTILP